MTETVTNYLEILTTYRRRLHQIPEIGRDLPETKKYLVSVLEQLDCELTFLCDTGICAFFDKGQKDTYAFRADMDALPITEASGCECTSLHDGKMHACAHDGHMAMVLALGQYVHTLNSSKNDALKHNVLLIFQPAEETLGGAEDICKSGILEKYNTARVFGIHIWPFTEAGTISSKPDAFMPRSAEINIIVHGKAAHGTAPYKGVDALYIGAELIKKIYMKHSQIPGAIPHFPKGMSDLPEGPEAAPEDMTLIQFGKMVSGSARNIVSDNADILGTVRAFSDDDFDKIIGLIKSCIRESENEYNCSIDFSRSDGYPPVVNDRVLYKEILPILTDLSNPIKSATVPVTNDESGPSRGSLPDCATIPEVPAYNEMTQPLMISDDFSFFGHYAPAIYFALGTGTGIPLHSSDFDFDEEILLSGFNLYKSLLI